MKSIFTIAIVLLLLTLLRLQIITEVSAQKAPTTNPAKAQTLSESDSEPNVERYALLISVQKYDKSSGLRPLNYTQNDILKTAELLRQIGYRDENIIVMTEIQQDPRLLPERAKILHQLTVLLRDCTKQSSILIGFAGHGVQFKEDDDSYFCPLDSEVENKETLISLKTVYKALAGCKAGFKLVLSDACRNDPFSPTVRGLNILQEDAAQPDEQPPSGIASFYSCSNRENAYEDPDLRHGVFFHFVITGMRGDADLDEDRKVTLPELEYFVKRRVSDYVRRYFNGKRQMPNLRGNTSGVVTLAKLPDDTISIKLPPGADDKKLAKPRDAAEENQPIKVSYTNGIGMPLLLVPEGEYLMGAFNKYDGYDEWVGADAMPQHRVRISKPFYLGVYEVTQREYQEIMGDNPSGCSDTGVNAENVRRAVERQGKDYLHSTKTDFHPVENITWKQAVEFTKRLSKREGRVYRLPTEAEWEYALRAGKQTVHPWEGDANTDHQLFENIKLLNVHGVSSPVGRMLPNRWGFYDMTGNVWEFCSDYYDSEYYRTSPSVDPQGPKLPSIRLTVRRGYGYDAWGVRYAAKRGYQPETRASASIGFRVVLEVADEELKTLSNQKGITVDELRALLPATSSLDEAKKSLERARKKFNAGKNGALVDLEKALKLNPGYFLADVGKWQQQRRDGGWMLYDLNGNNQKLAKAFEAYDDGIHFYEDSKHHESIAKHLQAFNTYPKFTWAANNLAYNLATCKETQVRDPVGAIDYAESACRATGWQYWVFLGTLARVYAEAGDFKKAAVVIEAYIRLAPKNKLPNSGEPPVGLEEYEVNLERMRKQLPWKPFDG